MPELAKQVNAILGGTQAAPSVPSGGSAASNSNSSAHTQKGFGGSYTCMVDTLNVRNAPRLSGGVVDHIYKGGKVTIEDTYYINDGYVWGTYTDKGNRRYVAVGKHTGKAEANDYLIKGGTVSSSSSSGNKKTIPSGAYRTTTALNVRSAPSINASVVATYPKGSTINSIGSDATIADGYVWAHYKAYSGATRWVAVGKSNGSATYLQKV